MLYTEEMERNKKQAVERKTYRVELLLHVLKV